MKYFWINSLKNPRKKNQRDILTGNAGQYQGKYMEEYLEAQNPTGTLALHFATFGSQGY